jgi:hypothetical protein
VLGGSGDTTLRVSAHGGLDEGRDSSRIARVCPPRQRGTGHGGDVGDRREIDVHTEGAELAARLGRRVLQRGRIARRGRTGDRPGTRDVAYRPALLIGGDDRAPSPGLLQRPGQFSQLRRRGDVVAKENRSGTAMLAQRPRDVGGSCGAGEAQHDELAEVVVEGVRLGGSGRLLPWAGSGGRRPARVLPAPAAGAGDQTCEGRERGQSGEHAQAPAGGGIA